MMLRHGRGVAVIIATCTPQQSGFAGLSSQLWLLSLFHLFQLHRRNALRQLWRLNVVVVTIIVTIIIIIIITIMINSQIIIIVVINIHIVSTPRPPRGGTQIGTIIVIAVQIIIIVTTTTIITIVRRIVGVFLRRTHVHHGRRMQHCIHDDLART